MANTERDVTGVAQGCSPPCTTESHARLKRDSAAWGLLPLLGVQHIPAYGDEPAAALALKNCRHCNSTLSRPVQR